MKGAFGKKVKLGDTILYSTNSSAGTEYTIGEVVKLFPNKYIDRISVRPTKTTKRGGVGRTVTLYAQYAIVLPFTGEEAC